MGVFLIKNKQLYTIFKKTRLQDIAVHKREKRQLIQILHKDQQIEQDKQSPNSSVKVFFPCQI